MQELSNVGQTGYLLSVAAIAVAFLLILIMKFKVHAFVSLIIVSFLTAVATGIKIENILPSKLGGFGGTLASVALLVGLGAMIGKILDISGGAQVLADTLINAFGEKRAPLAVGVASLFFAFPIFFDAGLMVMLPVVLTVAKRMGGSLLTYALPATGAFSVMHVFMIPHPGPVAAAMLLNANVSYLIGIGLIIAIPTWFCSSYLFGLWAGKKWNVAVNDLFATQNAEKPANPPKFSTVIFILLTPVILIFINAIISSLQKYGVLEQSTFLNYLSTIGQTPIALLITVILCVITFNKSLGAKKIETLCEKALAPICSVVLVTGAGGMFGGILRESGIGNALATVLSDFGIPVILAAFIISSCLRIAQGSATVAVTTTAALIAPIVNETVGLTPVETCSIVLSIAAGSVICSHFNDSGFWLVKGLFGIDEKLTLKTWTVLETLISIIGFTLACVFYILF